MYIERFVHYDITFLHIYKQSFAHTHTHTQTLTFIAEFILSAFNPFEKRTKSALSAPRMANYAIKHSNQIHKKKPYGYRRFDDVYDFLLLAVVPLFSAYRRMTPKTQKATLDVISKIQSN